MTANTFSAKRRFLAPDLATTFALVALALVAFRPLIMTISPHDFWWHLAEGRRIATEGRVPQIDYFSYTQYGKPFFDQMWLSQWLLFKIYQAGGIPLIVFAQALIITATYGLMLWLAARRANDAKIAALILMLGVMPVSFDNWPVRPQSFAFPCFALFVAILTAHRFKWKNWWPRALWLLPLIEIFWANAHGSFPLGIILVALTLIGETVRHFRGADVARKSLVQLGFCLLLCGAAIFVNPRGFEVIDYVRFVLNSPETRLSAEWLPPDLKTANGILFFAFLGFYCIAICVGRHRITLTDVLVSLPFGIQGVREGRSIVWFALAAFPVIAAALSREKKAVADAGKPALNLILLGFVWLLPLAVLPWWKSSLGLPSNIGELLDPDTPIAAVRALQELPKEQRPKRLWHDEATGSYLIWAAPEQKVFNDTRFEMYPLQQWQDSIDLRNAERAAQTIKKYRFDGFLLRPDRHAKLLDYLRKHGGWREVFKDEYWILLVKA